MNKKLIKTMVLAAVAAIGVSAVAGASSNDHHKYSKHGKHGKQYQNSISAEQAMKMALKRVPGATYEHIKEFDADEEDGHMVYEGEISYNGYDYEFEIDGRNGGHFTEWDVDRND